MKTRPSQCQIKSVPDVIPGRYYIQIRYKNRMVISESFHQHGEYSFWAATCSLFRYIRRNFHQDDARIILKSLRDFTFKYDHAKHLRVVQDETRRLIDTL